MKKWFVIHTQTGQEERVKASLESRKEHKNMAETIDEILVPTEKVAEVRSGKRKITTRKFYPGYVLIHMEMNENSWYFVKNTPGVSSFIGSGRKPIPLANHEIEAIIKASEEKQEKFTPKIIFERGEAVRVKEGPFLNFNGFIDEVNPQKGKLKVMVSIFGRTTPVELEYWQVEKV